jgi:hypothetical protein
MPKRISPEELDVVRKAVARFPFGGSIEEISRALESPLPRRTLQRRLGDLIDKDLVDVAGIGRGTRYSPTKETGLKADRPTAELHLSRAAEAIREAIRAPIHKRKPVGYNREFLDRYQPNTTFYLPERSRSHLAEIGASPDEEMPAGTYARQILDRLLIDLSWNSSRLEGNTYSLLETERLLKLGESAEDKNAGEAQMILNHKEAIELLVDNAAEIGFNRYTILNLHGLLSNNLLADPQAGGRLRSILISIGGTVYHPLSEPQVIEECFDLLLVKANAIADPFEQAFFVMVQLPYLQPFEDVNKRVSRLAANIPLIRRNLAPLSFVDVPERDYIDGMLAIYEMNEVALFREVFVWAYERSCARYAAVRQSLGAPDRFRMKYRQRLGEIVAEVVRRRMDRKAAADFISREATTTVPRQDMKRFVQVAETEIMSLHAGNFARYRLRPSEYEAWRAAWR